MGPERDVEQHLPRRDSSRPPARIADEDAHLLVARSAKALLFRTFSDRPADVCCSVGPLGEVRDLGHEASRNARREEAHVTTVPENLSRVSHGFVPKP